jgi:hypothetical protein
MITRFHTSGASAGTVKCSNELSMPTITPDSASSKTVGNRIRPIVTVRSLSSGLSAKPGATIFITNGATSSNASVTPPRISRIIRNSVEATRKASFFLPVSSSSVKTGTKAPWRAASANSARTRFGTWNAIVNADIGPVTPKYLAATTSRTSPAIRDRPVAAEKNAVLTARRRPLCVGDSTAPVPAGSVVVVVSLAATRPL